MIRHLLSKCGGLGQRPRAAKIKIIIKKKSTNQANSKQNEQTQVWKPKAPEMSVLHSQA